LETSNKKAPVAFYSHDYWLQCSTRLPGQVKALHKKHSWTLLSTLLCPPAGTAHLRVVHLKVLIDLQAGFWIRSKQHEQGSTSAFRNIVGYSEKKEFMRAS
jgi:hypothetical protein